MASSFKQTFVALSLRQFNAILAPERIVRLSLLFGTTIAVSLMVATCSQTATAADMTLDEIRGVLDRFTQNIETLAGRQRAVFQTKPFKRAPGTGVTMEDLTIETDFKVDLVHGRTYLAGSRTWYYREISDKPFAVESLTMFDGEQEYSLGRTLKQIPIATKVPNNTIHRLAIMPTNYTADNHSVMPLAGLPVSGPHVSLAAVLRAPDAKITGRRALDKHQCVDVTATIGTHRIDASLDPTASCLPRRIAVFNLKSPGSKNAPTSEYLANDFKTFSIPTSDESVSFPTRGRHIHMNSTTVELELLDLRINTSMTKSEFQIDMDTLPPGVRIDTPNKSRFTADRKDLWDDLDKLVSEETESIEAVINQSRRKTTEHTNTLPIRVAPRPTNYRNPLVIGFIAIGFLVVGLGLTRRRR